MSKANVSYLPGPKSQIPAKIAHQLLKDPLNTLRKTAEEYGDISHIRIGSNHIY